MNVMIPMVVPGCVMLLCRRSRRMSISRVGGPVYRVMEEIGIGHRPKRKPNGIMMAFHLWSRDNNTIHLYRKQLRVVNPWGKSVNHYWQYQSSKEDVKGIRCPSFFVFIPLIERKMLEVFQYQHCLIDIVPVPVHFQHESRYRRQKQSIRNHE